MNKRKSANVLVLVALLLCIMASSAFALPIMAFRPVSQEIGVSLSPQARQAIESAAGSNPQLDLRPKIPLTEPIRVPLTPSTPTIDVARPTVPVTPRIPVPIPGDEEPTPDLDITPRIPPVTPRIPVPIDTGDDDDDTPVFVPHIPVVDIPVRIPPIHIPGDDDDDTPTLPGIGMPRIPVGPEIPPIHFPVPKYVDLAVVSFEPSTARAAYGEEVSFKFTMKNEGTVGSTFKWTFSPNVPSKPVLPSPFSLVTAKEVTKELTLGSGESHTEIVTFRYTKSYPSMVQPGVSVDVAGKVKETNERNNVLTSRVWLYDSTPTNGTNTTPATRPDLTISVIPTDPTAYVGDALDFDVTVSNAGDAGVADTYFRYSFGDGVELLSEHFAVAANSSVVRSVSKTFTAPGRYAVSVMVDPANSVVESDETNNRAVFLLDVSERPVYPACSDQLDNDGDGLMDLADPGCVDASDDDEFNVVVQPLCNDQIDNDGDGLIDMADPGCSDLSDDDESNAAPVTACSDGIDNDADGLVDLEDIGCGSAEDDDEFNEIVVLPYCSDGLDNDHDGLIDLADPGCADAGDDDEFNLVVEFQCSDDIDNDGDGLVDSADPGCASEIDDDEFDVVLPPVNDTDGNETNETGGNETNETVNLAPIPVLSVTPLNGTAPLNVTIDGSASHDIDGTIESHSWVITGPAGYLYSELDVAGVPGSMVREFTVAGEYSIMLLVADDDGIADSVTQIVALAGADGIVPGVNDTNTTFNQTNTTGTQNTTNTTNTTTTTTTSGPSVSSRSVTSITSSSAIIKWHTNVNADAEVSYGTDDDDLDDDKSSSGTRTSHSITLDSLDAQTKYYYKIKSCADGHCTEVGPYSFTTLVAGSSSGSDDDEESDGSDTDYSDLLGQNSALISSRRSTTQTVSDVALPQSTVARSGDSVEVVFAPMQFMEVEEEVCSFKLLFWCLWHDTVTRKIPIPSLTGGVQFFI
jgi:hypothetical protein